MSESTETKIESRTARWERFMRLDGTRALLAVRIIHARRRPRVVRAGNEVLQETPCPRGAARSLGADRFRGTIAA